MGRNSEEKMKMTWNRSQNKNKKRPLLNPNLPFDFQSYPSTEILKQDASSSSQNDDVRNTDAPVSDVDEEKSKNLALEFEARGNELAEEGKYRQALAKWETAITMMPNRAVLHEQKAQILLELGDAWNALKAATRAAELEPTWAEAWVTVGRSQLNFGEPDSAIESFDKALAIKPEFEEAKNDRQTALHLVKKRKQLHSTGLSLDRNRFLVADEG